MKLTVITALLLLAASTSVYASASNDDVATAKEALGQALYKSAMLTGNMNGQGQADAVKAGHEMAEEMALRLDNVVVAGLNQGADCGDITANVQKSFELMQEQAVSQYDASSAIRKAMDKVPLSAANYASVQCQNLTSQ